MKRRFTQLLETLAEEGGITMAFYNRLLHRVEEVHMNGDGFSNEKLERNSYKSTSIYISKNVQSYLLQYLN